MTQSRAKPASPRRVLIVKPSSLGDVVTAMPLLRGLRRTFGDIHIAWLIGKTALPLIAHDTDVNDCVIFDRKTLGRAWRSPGASRKLKAFVGQLKRGRYDWAIDAQGLLRSALLARATRAEVRAGFAEAREGSTLFYTHRVSVDRESHTVDRNIALARALGIDARPEDMTLQVSHDAQEFANEFVDQRGLDGGFLLCVPPTRWQTKLYPVRHWRTVIRSLKERIPVVLGGSPGDRELCEAVAEGLGDRVINAAGETDIAQMVGLIAASSGVICCESAANFIAPAVGVDVVTLIGPTRPSRTGPYQRGRAIVADVPCQGCLRKHCPHITCMELVEPAEVISAAEEMLRSKGAASGARGQAGVVSGNNCQEAD